MNLLQAVSSYTKLGMTTSVMLKIIFKYFYINA